MQIEQIGDITLTHDYWDCECDGNYIHHRSVDVCPKCSCSQCEMPNSRLNEVLSHMPQLRSYFSHAYGVKVVDHIAYAINHWICKCDGDFIRRAEDAFCRQCGCVRQNAPAPSLETVAGQNGHARISRIATDDCARV